MGNASITQYAPPDLIAPCVITFSAKASTTVADWRLASALWFISDDADDSLQPIDLARYAADNTDETAFFVDMWEFPACFRTPGDYTVHLCIKELGEADSWASVQVTIDDIEVVADTLRYVSDSASGSDDGLTDSTPWTLAQFRASFAGAFTNDGINAALFERGSVWTGETATLWAPATNTLPGYMQLGVYGTGAKPDFSYASTNTSSFVRKNTGGHRLTINGLIARGGHAVFNSITTALGGGSFLFGNFDGTAAGRAAHNGTHITLVDCEGYRFDNGVMLSHYMSGWSFSDLAGGDYDHFSMNGCTMADVREVGLLCGYARYGGIGNCTWGRWSDPGNQYAFRYGATSLHVGVYSTVVDATLTEAGTNDATNIETGNSFRFFGGDGTDNTTFSEDCSFHRIELRNVGEGFEVPQHNLSAVHGARRFYMDSCRSEFRSSPGLVYNFNLQATTIDSVYRNCIAVNAYASGQGFLCTHNTGSEAWDSVLFINNSTRNAHSSITGSGVFLDLPASTNGATGFEVYNNAAQSANGNTSYGFIEGGGNANSDSVIKSDYNIFSSLATVLRWQVGLPSTGELLSAWNSSSGEDANSSEETVALFETDMSPTATSPVLAAGTPLLVLDYNGFLRSDTAPDVGAIELDADTAPDGPSFGDDMAGSFAGTSTAAGDIQGLTELAGSFDGSSTAAGAIDGRSELAGSFAGTSTFVGVTDGPAPSSSISHHRGRLSLSLGLR